MLTIHGRINSINVQKVVLTCEELGLAYERHDAGGVFGKVRTPEFQALNPNSLVPVLVDGDLVLWESNAIVRYLAAMYGEGTLWPKDPATRARSDRWMDWQAFAFYAAYAPAFMGLIRTPEDKRDGAAIAASVAKTEPLMAILDSALAGRDFLVGDHPTIGDIGLLPAVFRWLNMPVERAPTPNVTAWCARLAARKGYNKALMLPLT
ncbi:MAG: glutathione S-transferase family protein [Beijerinckiaceae bacterium]